MINLAWLQTNRNNLEVLAEKKFFLVKSTALFLPSLDALGLLGRATVEVHTNTLYDMDQVVIHERTIAYLIYFKCPYYKVFDNGMLLHARKVLDKKKHASVEHHNTLPHFQIVNSADHNTIIFCRDVTSVPRT